MKPAVIEPASQADIPALADLLSLLFAQEVEFTPDTAAQRKGLSKIIGNPELGAVLLVRVDGAIEGMVNLLFTVSTALGERVALLEDLIVAPQARGRGLGGVLLNEAISFARLRGCRRITLLTDGDNEAAHRFYARHGFVASRMVPLRLVLT